MIMTQPVPLNRATLLATHYPSTKGEASTTIDVTLVASVVCIHAVIAAELRLRLGASATQSELFRRPH